MKTSARLLIMTSLCSVASAFGQSAIEGEVKGVDGFPLKAAEIRAERQDANGPAAVAKTDAKGHFAIKGLAVGTYNVNVMSSGTAVSSTRIATRAGKPVMISFDMKQPRKAVAGGGKKKKKFLWMPAETGSHLGGHYVEVEEDDSADPGTQHLSKATGAAVRQYQRTNNVKAGPGGG